MATTKEKSTTKEAINWLQKFLRYTDYIGAAQLYLEKNHLLDQELKQSDIKERVLGHWGSVPGQNFI